MKDLYIVKLLMALFIISSNFIALPAFGDDSMDIDNGETVIAGENNVSEESDGGVTEREGNTDNKAASIITRNAVTTGAAVVTTGAQVSCVSAGDEDSFIQALEDGKDVMLTQNITLDKYCMLKTKDKVTIDMNDHTITTLAGGYYEFDGPFIFNNGPEGKSMLTIEKKSYVSLINGVTFNIDNDDCIGVCIKKDSWPSIYKAVFNVNGNNCTGVESEESLDYNSNCNIDFSEIYINGNNSTGISCNNDTALQNNAYAKLLFNKITATGNNSCTVKAGRVICDSSLITPEAENQTSIKRTITNFLPEEYIHIQLPINSEPLSLPDNIRIEAENVNDHNDSQSFVMPVKWQDNVDYNTVGSYRIYGEIVYPFDNLEHMSLSAVNYVTVDIKDPDVLDIGFISNTPGICYDDDGSRKCSLEIKFLKEPLNSQDNILYISEDDGKTWKVHEECSLIGDKLCINKIDYNKKYKFKYVLADGTESNILTIKINPDNTYESLAGDRDNNDLDNPQIKPDNNEENNNSSYGNHNEENVSDGDENNSSTNTSNCSNSTSSGSTDSKKYNTSKNETGKAAKENNNSVEVFSGNDNSIIGSNNMIENRKIVLGNKGLDNYTSHKERDVDENENSMKNDIQDNSGNGDNGNNMNENEENQSRNEKEDNDNSVNQDTASDINENTDTDEDAGSSDKNSSEKTDENNEVMHSKIDSKGKTGTAVAAVAFSAACAGGVIYMMKGKIR